MGKTQHILLQYSAHGEGERFAVREFLAVDVEGGYRGYRRCRCCRCGVQAGQTPVYTSNLPRLYIGDDTDSIYNEVRLDIALPTGIRGGSLPTIIKTSKNFDGLCMVISPNDNEEQNQDYGKYLILWYKPDGGTANKIYLALTSDGYETYNCIADLRFGIAQKEWVKNHTKVRFKGFSTDNRDAEKFVESPRGIDRDGADVYINPEFSIQY